MKLEYWCEELKIKITLQNYIYFALKHYRVELVSSMNCVKRSELLSCSCSFSGGDWNENLKKIFSIHMEIPLSSIFQHIADLPYTAHASNPCSLLAVPTAQSLWWFLSHFQGFHLAHPVSTSQHNTTPHNTSHLLYVTAWMLMDLHINLTSPDVKEQWQHYYVNIKTTDFKYLAVTHSRGCLKSSTVYKTHKHLARY